LRFRTMARSTVLYENNRPRNYVFVMRDKV